MMAASQGYGFVPLSGEVHRCPRPEANLDRLPPNPQVPRGTVCLSVEVTYKTVQPIHIGAGFWTLRDGKAVRMSVRSGQRAVVPGSSMKGLLRARYEAITKSCAGGEKPPRDRMLTGSIPSRSYPNYQVTFGAELRKHEVFTRCAPKSGMCAACALFGVMSQRGRVAVRDLVGSPDVRLELGKMPLRFSPRPHHLGHFKADESNRRLNVTRLRGRKFHLGASKSEGRGEWTELIPAGTLLAGNVLCQNVTLAEVGGLLSSVGYNPESQLKVGSAKAYEFGQITLEKIRFEMTGAVPDHFLERVRKAFVESPDYHAAGEKQLVTMHGGSWQ